MKKIKTFQEFEKRVKRMNKMLAYGFVFVFAVFISGSLNSLHAQSNNSLSTADSAKRSGELKINDYVQVLQDEVVYLRNDRQSGTPTVDGSASVSVGTPFHSGLISAYTQAANNVSNGMGVQQQMLTILQGSLFAGSDDGAVKPVLDLNASQQKQLNDIVEFVSSWNASNVAVSDMEQALVMIRELKN